jgi:hypothetical protein
MKVTIGICKEGEIFRAYCAHEGENVAFAKSTSSAEALEHLFSILVTEHCDFFYDGKTDEPRRKNECFKKE